MSTFPNLYYKRAVGAARPCFICFKPTTAVLSTLGNTDFLYTCETHLSDPGFATPVKAEEPEKPALSEEELKKIKEEWEAKQKAKKEKEKEKAKEKDKEDKDKDKSKTPPKASTSSILSTPSPTPSTSSHAKRQVAQAKQIAPLLPFVPPGQLRDV